MNSMVWEPQSPQQSQMAEFMRQMAVKHQIPLVDYASLHQWSIDQPAAFWAGLMDFFQIDFHHPAETGLREGAHMLDAQWFPGATLNYAEQLLKRRDEHLALVCLNEAGERQSLTYKALAAQVAACQAGLIAAGVKTGDRVAAIMPNQAETVIAMLAAASLGAIWSSCSPDFGVQAAIDRLGQVEPKILFISDGHQYNGKIHSNAEKIAAIQSQMPTVEQIVLCRQTGQMPILVSQDKICLWSDFLQPDHQLYFVPLPFNHPLFILFSSGTTGKPKCIVHGAGGTLLQHVKELGLHCDLRAEDRLCFYTTCGWMMWNWICSSLALGLTLILYEGSPTWPDAGSLFRLIEAEKITVFGTSAKFISAVEKAGVLPRQIADLSSLRLLLSTGSPLLPKNYDFVYQQIKEEVQLSSISGGTDIISCFALGCPLLPVYRGELQCLGLGMAVAVFNAEGQPVVGERGELVCTRPFPSMPVGFWRDPQQQAYRHAYFEQFDNIWTHGDFAELTARGGLIIYGRSDAVLNPGGVRIGTAEIYRQVEKIPEIVDSLVIGQDWQDDVRVVLFVKLQPNLQLTETLAQQIRQIIKVNASPRHVPAKILQVTDIPRTINGKIVELAVRQIVHGQPIQNLQSLANPEALDQFKNRPELAC